MTQPEHSKSAPSTSQRSTALAFLGILLLGIAVILMTLLAGEYANRAVAAARPVVSAPVSPQVAPSQTPPTPAAPSVAAPAADTAPVADTAPAADTAPVADTAAASTPAAASPAAGPWEIKLNPETNEPDAAGLAHIAAISAALEADPRATVTLVGVNNFRKSSKRALLAAQSVLEHLRTNNAMHARRATATGEQTKDAEGLLVRATIHGGGK